VKQLKMADCCNNVQIEPSLLTGNLLDVSGNGIARPTIASAAYAGRHTANHSMNLNQMNRGSEQYSIRGTIISGNQQQMLNHL
jgi:hypothetical protein